MHAPGEGARDGLAEDGVVLAEPDAPRRSHSCEPPAARRPPPAARRRRLLAGRPRRQRCPCQIGLEEEAAMSSKTLLRLPAHDPAVAARIELDAHHMTLAGQPLAAPRPLASCHENLPTLETPSATEKRKAPQSRGFHMRRRGLEPPPTKCGPGPQPGASTNSAIGARATASIDRPCGSAGVAHARGDAVDGEEARPRQLVAVAVARTPGAAQELDLEE